MEKKSVNLCSVYMLPLIGLNQWSFGNNVSNFVNSYVSEDNAHLVVELKGTVTSIITGHQNYKFAYSKDKNSFAVFEVPAAYKSDVAKFREGKYSTFSDQAKKLIKKNSGLKYKKATPQGLESAVELLALDKEKDLKVYLEEKLGVRLSDEAELASIPGEENFIKLNLEEV